MAIAASWIYAEEWATKLQEFLDEPVKFKDICKIIYTNKKVNNNPYMTDPVISGLSRGTAYTYDLWSETNETLVIDQTNKAATFWDQADLSQSTFMSQMESAERQGILLNQRIEAAVYGDHANFTNFGNGDITGGTVADTALITVSSNTIDDIIRHVERVIIVAGGQQILEREGGFFVWRPADFQELRAFSQANGYVSADRALTDRSHQGFEYMGFTHYSSNLFVANHVFAGAKKVHVVGILKDTYGQIKVIQDPGLTSGVGVVSRVDYGVKTFTKPKPILLDINVA